MFFFIPFHDSRCHEMLCIGPLISVYHSHSLLGSLQFSTCFCPDAIFTLVSASSDSILWIDLRCLFSCCSLLKKTLEGCQCEQVVCVWTQHETLSRRWSYCSISHWSTKMNILYSKAFMKRENIWLNLSCNVSFKANSGIRVEKSFLILFN